MQPHVPRAGSLGAHTRPPQCRRPRHPAAQAVGLQAAQLLTTQPLPAAGR